MCLVGSPVKYGVASQVLSHLQAEAGVSGTHAIYKNLTGPRKRVGNLLNFENPVYILNVKAADEGMCPIRFYGQFLSTRLFD